MYTESMSELLDKAVELVRALPQDAQDEIAQAMIRLVGDNGAEPIDSAHLAAILEGLAQARSGNFASVQEVDAAFRCFDP
jgi:Ca2+-binding EF-hand superfamily protein